MWVKLLSYAISLIFLAQLVHQFSVYCSVSLWRRNGGWHFCDSLQAGRTEQWQCLCSSGLVSGQDVAQHLLISHGPLASLCSSAPYRFPLKFFHGLYTSFPTGTSTASVPCITSISLSALLWLLWDVGIFNATFSCAGVWDDSSVLSVACEWRYVTFNGGFSKFWLVTML